MAEEDGEVAAEAEELTEAEVTTVVVTKATEEAVGLRTTDAVLSLTTIFE